MRPSSGFGSAAVEVTYRLESASGGSVTVAGNLIVESTSTAQFTIQLGVGSFHPGLINAHDHLHRNHYPRLGNPPYKSVYEWGQDLHDRFAPELERAKRIPNRDAMLFGAFKNLLGGVTTVVHHDAWDSHFDDAFPIRVAPLLVAHSPRLEPDLEAFASVANQDAAAFAIHLAEGTDHAMAAEVSELADHGLLNDRLIAIHAVGVDGEGIHALQNANCAIVWCPTSNVFLYGATVPSMLLDGRVDVLLGTDSLLSGAGTLLHELRAARRMKVVDDQRLLAAVGSTAAGRLNRPAPLLTPGSMADVVFLRKSLLDASPHDVALVVVDGAPRVGDEKFDSLFTFCGVQTEPLRAAGCRPMRKLVAKPLGSLAQRIIAETPECGRFLKS